MTQLDREGGGVQQLVQWQKVGGGTMCSGGGPMCSGGALRYAGNRADERTKTHLVILRVS